MNTRETKVADYSPAVLIIPVACAGLRLDAALAKLFPEHSRSRLQNWMKEGRVTIDGNLADARRKRNWNEYNQVLRDRRGDVYAEMLGADHRPGWY